MKSNMKRIAALALVLLMVLAAMPAAMALEYYSGSLSVGGRVKKPTPTPQITATPEPTPAPTATPEPTPAPTATPEPTAAPTATPEPAPVLIPEVPQQNEIVSAGTIMEESMQAMDVTTAQEAAFLAAASVEVEEAIDGEGAVELPEIEVEKEKQTVLRATNVQVSYRVDEEGNQVLDDYGHPIRIVSFDPIADVPVNADAHIRLDADGMSEILVTIPTGGLVTVIGLEGDWVKVTAEGATGYIYIDQITAVHAIQGIPEEEKIPDEDPTKNFRVTIFTSRRSVVAPGEEIVLTSKIEGFDGYEIMYQWECDKGAGFENIEGANADSYTYTATIETLSYDWRLTVYYR